MYMDLYNVSGEKKKKIKRKKKKNCASPFNA